MSAWDRFLSNVQLRRFTVLGIIILVLYLFRSMMNVMLLTFIFTLLVVKATKWIKKYVPISSKIIVITIYLLVVLGMYYVITKYVPQLTEQAVETTKQVVDFYSQPKNLPNDEIMRYVESIIEKNNVLGQVKGGVQILWQSLTSVGEMGVTLFLSLILSFFFTIEDNAMLNFSRLFLTSRYSWFFKDIHFFGKIFVSTFGVVIEAQFFIAICNTIITTVIMAFMGMPQLILLSIMIFILSLIPVAGVIISVIPLSIVGYSIGGIYDVIYIIVMIIVVHTLEAYVLNPKFMSSKTHLPIFYTFIILLIGEHFWGVWGLICGVPVFTFFLDILGVKAHPKKETSQ
ncbi:AI-2E family transporter [Lentilactobacillus laojiaonis]|uniref:AI-2E family transporter n=1 Tax=Lentilactobacillus laojiaonis TaxID=2883998 RepID=UPI001D0A2106|nr:AI-2E family transporter [Lentilactobacillus laojiaonis]